MWAFAHLVPLVIPLNAANLCPAPSPVVDAINTMRQIYNQDVSQQIRTQCYALIIAYARNAIAAALGAEVPGEFPNLALVRNASESNNILSSGFTSWDGGNVVVWSENHPTNLGAWMLRGQRFGFSVQEVMTPEPPSVDSLVAAFTDAIDAETRILTFSETSNVSGLRIPREAIEAIGAVTRPAGIHLHIDGAQTWGAQALDLGGLPIDSFAASSHKWFFGPKETGIFYIRRERTEAFEPLIYGYDANITIPPWDDLPTTARRFELLGQRDDANLMALFLTQCLHNLIGAAAIDARIRELSESLRTRLLANDWTVSTPEGELSHGVIITEVADTDREALYNYLYDEAHIAASPTGGLRLCPHIYNNESDLELVVKTMNSWRDQRVHRP